MSEQRDSIDAPGAVISFSEGGTRQRQQIVGLLVMGMGLLVFSGAFQSHGPIRPDALVFVAVGALVLLLHSGATVDPRTRRVSRWWKVLVPIWTKFVDFDEVIGVTLTRETRKSKNGSYTVYPVRVTTSDKPFLVTQGRSYQLARYHAEVVAGTVWVPLEDSSTADTVIRQPEELDESVVERLHREGKAPQEPAPLLTSRIAHGTEGASETFTLPRRGLRRGDLVPLAIPVAFGVFLAVANWKLVEGWTRGHGDVLPLVVMGILLAAAVRYLVVQATVREHVEVTESSLQVRRSSLFHRKITTFPLENLEELRLLESPFSPGPGMLLLRSDRASAFVGESLRGDERQWLCDMLVYLVAR